MTMDQQMGEVDAGIDVDVGFDVGIEVETADQRP